MVIVASKISDKIQGAFKIDSRSSSPSRRNAIESVEEDRRTT
jgi:hypothetical protein